MSSNSTTPKLKPISRLLVLISSLMMAGAYFFSVWYIDLEAPQYPEGLSLQIWVNGVKGDLSSINNLNHYIGMGIIDNNMFPEFVILPYLLGVMIVCGILVALKNSRKWLFWYLVFLCLIAMVASYDFWRWEYEYGHNLNPHAAIKIPGMAYQPPFLGYKQLLNFLAGSLPDIGGWLIIGPSIILANIYGYERFYRTRKSQKNKS